MSDKTAKKASQTALRPKEELDGKKKKSADLKEEKEAKRESFPFGGLILLLTLIAVILFSCYFGLYYMEQRDVLASLYESRIAAAEADLSAAEAEYAEADPDSEAHVVERRQLSEEMIAAAKLELADMQQKAAETDAAVRAAEERVAELESDEDYEYFMSVYEEYLEGRAYVEELLSGD